MYFCCSEKSGLFIFQMKGLSNIWILLLLVVGMSFSVDSQVVDRKEEQKEQTSSSLKNGHVGYHGNERAKTKVEERNEAADDDPAVVDDNDDDSVEKEEEKESQLKMGKIRSVLASSYGDIVSSLLKSFDQELKDMLGPTIVSFNNVNRTDSSR